MKAVVLVGGFGTRLRPLTVTTPKQMLSVVDRPMIEYVVSTLKRGGVSEVTLALGYKEDLFRASYPDAVCGGVSLSYAVEPEPLDTAGAVRFAADTVGIDEPFLVVNGDVLTDIDVRSLWDRHREIGAQATIALTRVQDPSRFGVVPTDAQGKVLGFVEKPSRDEAPTNWINAGIYVLEPEILGRIARGRRVSIEREVFPSVVAENGLWAVKSEAYWIDIGTPSTYVQAQLDLIDGVRGPAMTAVAAEARVDEDAEVERSVVMEGATVAVRAVIRDSIIMQSAVIEEDASVDGSVIGPGAHIGRGAKVTRMSIVGDRVSVGAGRLVDGSKIPSSD
ncbi:MAG: NDP-sugar synthase [Acidimicrobiaceae bacterium]|nr:NDP-sugar synthase [Acidimicrobiaceae bacterium]MXW62662.1 NDP-sugar synthase [Acidimicrobiaceae bacterium]MXW74792.1 NDP-sugar synthase [Acidimicrobiaceae bacterium]MYA73423.1 NDP-sugar synthase [Acidimicrobiaceae bacterium]MYC42015.1 NDP-sugar synthase [Acidimicrobiaceae bacterium]